jgi:hypothetical protein
VGTSGILSHSFSLTLSLSLSLSLRLSLSVSLTFFSAHWDRLLVGTSTAFVPTVFDRVQHGQCTSEDDLDGLASQRLDWPGLR